MTKGKNNIFKRIDEWLRINHPLVWRTKVLQFVLFSTIFANLFMWFVIPWLFVESTRFFPDYNRITSMMFGFLAMSSPFLLYWGYRQVMHPLEEQSTKFYIFTWLTYSFCIFSLAVNCISFIHPTIIATTNLESKEALEADLAYHEENDFWYKSPSLDTAKFDVHKERISQQLIKYGLMSEDNTLDYNDLSKFEGSPHHSIITKDGLIVEYYLPPVIKDLLSKHEYREGKDSDHDFYLYLLPFIFLGALGLGAILLLLSLPRYVFTRNFQFSLPTIFGNNRLDEKRKTISGKLDGFLLTHFPTIWSTNIHNYIIHTFIFFVSIGLFMWILPVDLTIFKTLIDRIIRPPSVHFLTLFILFSISFPFWGYKQITTKNAPINVYKNALLLSSYFFTISFVPLFTTGVFKYGYQTSLFEGIDGVSLIIFISFFGAIWVLSSKFMSTAKSLYLGIPFICFSVLVGSFVSMFLFLFLSNSYVTGGLNAGHIAKYAFYIAFFSFISLVISRFKNIKILYACAIFNLCNIAASSAMLLVSISGGGSVIPDSGLLFYLLGYLMCLIIIPILSIPALALLSKAKSLPRE